MSILKPVDHQNIALRLIGMATCTPEHITQLAQAHNLPVSLTDMRRACDELATQEFAGRLPGNRFTLTTWGIMELPDVPLLTSYHLPCDDERADREASMIVAIEGDRHDAQ